MKKRLFIFILLVVLLMFCVMLAIATGGTPLPLSAVFDALLHPERRDMTGTLLWGLRLPRVIMAMVIGAALSGCGVVFQAILRNPLAEPYTLGVSGGGALGATIAIILGISGLPMVFLCFLGCSLSMLLVLGLASLKGFSNTMLILSGVIMSFLFSSIMMLIFSLSSSRDVHASVMWLMGNLSAAPDILVKVLVLIVIPLMICQVAFARDLNVLSLGDEKALHLGLDTKVSRAILFIIASLITGACVAVPGVIGFVGLIVPHVMRKAIGTDHHVLLPAAMLAGANLLILSDTLAQVLIRPLELPVGVITGILGGAFFLIMLLEEGEVVER